MLLIEVAEMHEACLCWLAGQQIGPDSVTKDPPVYPNAVQDRSMGATQDTPAWVARTTPRILRPVAAPTQHAERRLPPLVTDRRIVG